jgi:hypothetical protein
MNNHLYILAIGLGGTKGLIVGGGVITGGTGTLNG